MGIIAYCNRLKQRFKAMSFDAEEEISRHKIFLELLTNRWKTLATVFLLIIIFFIVDLAVNIWLTPLIITQPWFLTLNTFFVFPSMDTIVSLLSSIIAGIAAIIGVLLAISLVVIQLSAQKYPNRMVKFIIQEKIGAYVLDVLIISLLFSLWTLFFLQRGTNVPFISIVASLVLASLSILFTFVYGQYSLHFFRPQQSFRVITIETNKSLNILYKKDIKLGHTAIIKLRNQVNENIAVLTNFMDVLLASEKKDEDSWMGNTTLATILTKYISQKRFIDIDSGWYEYTAPQISYHPYERNAFYEEATLKRMAPKADTEWLERTVLQSLDNVQKKLFKGNENVTVDRNCLLSLNRAYSQIMKSCFEHQEFDILSLTLKNIESLSETLSDNNSVTTEFCDLLILLTECSIRGLDLSYLEKIIPTLRWKSQFEIFSLRLPKIYNDTLIEYQKKIETELIIEDKIVTPKEVIGADIVKMIESKQSIVYACYAEVFRLLSSLFNKANENKNVSEIEKILTVELICLRISIVNNKTHLSDEHIDIVMKHCLIGYALLDQKEPRKNVNNEIKLAHLHSVKSRSKVSQLKFFDCLAKIVAMEISLVEVNGEKSFAPEALQCLKASCSLVYVYSEFYQDKTTFNRIIDILMKNYDLTQLAEKFKILTKYEYSRIMLEYHSWFVDVFMKIRELPVSVEYLEGCKSPVFVRQHPSAFIKNMSDYRGIIECDEQVVKELRKRGNKQ